MIFSALSSGTRCLAQRAPFEEPDPASRETRAMVKSGQPLDLPKGLYEWTMAEQFMSLGRIQQR